MGMPRVLRSDNEEEYRTRPTHSWDTATTSGSRRELTAPYIRLNKMVPRRAHSGEPTKQDTLHVRESRTYILTSAWKKSRALRTRRQRVCGWSHCFGPQSASVGRLPRQMKDGSPPIRSSMGAARRCRCCRFSSRPTTECPGNAKGNPVPTSVIS